LGTGEMPAPERCRAMRHRLCTHPALRRAAPGAAEPRPRGASAAALASFGKCARCVRRGRHACPRTPSRVQPATGSRGPSRGPPPPALASFGNSIPSPAATHRAVASPAAWILLKPSGAGTARAPCGRIGFLWKIRPAARDASGGAAGASAGLTWRIHMYTIPGNASPRALRREPAQCKVVWPPQTRTGSGRRPAGQRRRAGRPPHRDFPAARRCTRPAAGQAHQRVARRGESRYGGRSAGRPAARAGRPGPAHSPSPPAPGAT
jgi:hypothetical protein